MVVAFAIQKVVETFQIKKATNACPKKDTLRKFSFCSRKKCSRYKRGKNAKKSVHPGKPNQARLNKIPDNIENKKRPERFIYLLMFSEYIPCFFLRDLSKTKSIFPTTNPPHHA